LLSQTFSIGILRLLDANQSQFGKLSEQGFPQLLTNKSTFSEVTSLIPFYIIHDSKSVAYPAGVLGGSSTPLFSCIIYKLIKLVNVVNIKKLN
jgi:hypothetical protein